MPNTGKRNRSGHEAARRAKKKRHVPEPEPSSEPDTSQRSSSDSESDPGEAPRAERADRSSRLTSQDDGWSGADQDPVESGSDEHILAAAKAMLKEHRPAIQDHEIETIIGTLDPTFDDTWTPGDEAALMREWNASKEKPAFEDINTTNPGTRIGLWEVSFHLYRCSPFAIISPLRNLRYQSIPCRNTKLEGGVLCPNDFCDGLSMLLTHPFWNGDLNILALALQFSVICRTDDRRVWDMPPTAGCPSLDGLRRMMEDTNGATVSEPIKDMHARAHELQEHIAVTVSDLLCYVAMNAKPSKHELRDVELTYKGVDMYSVTTWDLTHVSRALDTVPKHCHSALVSARVAYDNYQAARGPPGPPKATKLREFHVRAWLDEQRKFARSIANSNTTERTGVQALRSSPFGTMAPKPQQGDSRPPSEGVDETPGDTVRPFFQHTRNNPWDGQDRLPVGQARRSGFGALPIRTGSSGSATRQDEMRQINHQMEDFWARFKHQMEDLKGEIHQLRAENRAMFSSLMEKKANVKPSQQREHSEDSHARQQRNKSVVVGQPSPRRASSKAPTVASNVVENDTHLDLTRVPDSSSLASSRDSDVKGEPYFAALSKEGDDFVSPLPDDSVENPVDQENEIAPEKSSFSSLGLTYPARKSYDRTNGLSKEPPRSKIVEKSSFSSLGLTPCETVEPPPVSATKETKSVSGASPDIPLLQRDLTSEDLTVPGLTREHLRYKINNPRVRVRVATAPLIDVNGRRGLPRRMLDGLSCGTHRVTPENEYP